MSPPSLVLILVTLFLTSPVAHAIDHKNLDAGRPLRLQDAYPIAKGEWNLEAGAGFSTHDNLDRASFSFEIIYGALLNFQLELGTTLFTDPRKADEPAKSGDLHLGALYNFNQETMKLPAFGIRAGVDLPTGVDSSGVDFELMGLMTKSVGRLSLHLNAGYEFVGGAERGERDARYKVVVGPSFPLGAPKHTRTTVLADLFLEQAAHRDQDDVFGGEIGLRHQLNLRTVVDAGIGTEFSGPEDRSRFFAVTGVSVAF
jgi:hypothetical protein